MQLNLFQMNKENLNPIQCLLHPVTAIHGSFALRNEISQISVIKDERQTEEIE